MIEQKYMLLMFVVVLVVIGLVSATIPTLYIVSNTNRHPTKDELVRFNMTEQQMRLFCGERHMDFIYITQGGDIKCANFTDTVFYNTSLEENLRLVESLRAIHPNGKVEVLTYDVHGNSTWIAQT